MIPTLFRTLFFVVSVVIASAVPAQADPISAIAASITAFFGGSAAFAAFTVTVLQNIVRVGVSLLIAKLRRKDQPQAGVQSNQTTSGGTQPQATVLGRFATKGHLVYHNSHGKNNRWLVHVIEMGDMPGASLRRLIIDGEYTDLGEDNGLEGRPMSTKTDGDTVYGYISFFNGRQTSASSYLVNKFGEDEDYPWTADHILSGTCYAVLSFRRSDKIYSAGVPSYTFELDGPPLYDPRRDGTAGGLGAQRLSNSATWAHSTNPMVIAYNVLLGFRLPDGSVWGGGFEQEALPYTQWAAAMNACDLPVASETGTRSQFTAGFEVGFDEIPADFLDELLATANAQVVETGGYWYPVVGVASSVSAQVSDDDVLVSEGWKYAPFPGLEDTFNAVTVSYSSPSSLWEASTLETIIMEDWVAADGRQKLYELTLPMTYEAAQGRQLAQALLSENRRFRTHELPLPGEYAHLRPLQNISLTLADYGYSQKAFRVTEVAYDLQTLNLSVSLREMDPSDFEPDLTLELPETPRVTGPVVGSDAGVTGFAVAGETLTNGAGRAVAPAIRVSWDRDLYETRVGVSIEVRLQGQEASATVSTSDVAAGSYLYQPVQPNQIYEVRARTIASGRATVWSAWLAVSTPDVRITPDLLSEETFAEIRSQAEDAVEVLTDVFREDFLDPLSLDIEGLQDLSTAMTLVSHEEEARIAEDEALAQSINTVGAEVDGAVALVRDEEEARIAQDEALARSINTVGSDVDDVSARVNREESARVAQDDALARSVSQVSTVANNATAAVTQVSESVDGMSARHMLAVNVNDVVTGVVVASEAGSNGSVSSTVAFSADAFTITSATGSGGKVFAHYAQSRTINGQTFPAGTYLEGAYIGEAAIGRAQISDTLKSDNYLEDAKGRPTRGSYWNLATGEMKLANVVSSRQMKLATGSFTASGTFGNGDKFQFVNTGIRIGGNDVWQASNVALVATAAITNGIGALSGDGFNTFWGVDAHVIGGARWFGWTGGPQADKVWQKDPATLVDPFFATARDQRVFLRLNIEKFGSGFSIKNPTIQWSVFAVT